ncbi:hypothetical protein [Roseibium sediminis]|uniref:hypothetical protein n=1 Tax=Roseibium sediminis TaxID=1775174 RepID=UPI00123E13DE|nr:hypothetical protein [Roseibium sediminis]
MLRTEIKTIKNVVLMLACLGLAACQAADGTSQAPDTALVNSIMTGLGAVDPNEKPIDYKPRAPLAMPSKMDALPAPETAVAANQQTNWPTKEVNQEFEDLKKVYAKSTTGNERLSSEQMRGFTISGVSSKQDTARDKREAELIEGAVMTREELKSGHKQVTTEIDTANSLRRQYLIDPPTAYNEPSPDAPMPNIIKVEKQKGEKSALDNNLVDMRCLEETGGECRR